MGLLKNRRTQAEHLETAAAGVFTGQMSYLFQTKHSQPTTTKHRLIELQCNVACLCHCSALTITFGSLYHDDVEITRKNVTGILAAATLFSLVCIHTQMTFCLRQITNFDLCIVY